MISTFDQLRNQPELAQKLAREICQQHQLSGACVRITEGTALVFALGDRAILKIFSPEDTEFFQTEAEFLSRIHGKLPISTPELIFSGWWESCPYIIMERLRGVPLKSIWDSLPQAEKIDLMDQLGRAVRALHDLTIEPFHSLDWHGFIDQQRQNLIVNHRNFGLAQNWIDQLAGYVDSVNVDFHDPAQMVPLHTELMQEHIFVQRNGNRWMLAGLIDFEPSMIGHREYEFCAVGLFLTQGDKNLFRTFLAAYGYTEFDVRRRIMIFLLLHRYCNLNWFFTLLPEPMTTVDQLAQFWFST
jgi:hygromycin-B 7''-O-kinase